MNMKSKPSGTFTLENEGPKGKAAKITDEYLAVTLEDGRIISTPLEWYPRLVRATPGQRSAWKWWGSKRAIHWPLLDEHLGISGMLRGIPSIEHTRELAHAEA
jgi:Protein of unknown function (DUF2442)